MSVASCEWVQYSLKGSLPSSRQGHSCVAVNNSIFIFGGCCIKEDGDVIYNNDLYELKVKKEYLKWKFIKQTGDVPVRRDGHQMCYADGHIFLHGGKNDLYAQQCLTGTYSFKIDENRWYSENRDQVLAPRLLGCTMTYVNRSLFLFGGIENSKASNAMYQYHIKSADWTPIKTKGQPPQERCDHAASTVDDKIYYFGGCGGENKWLNDIHCFDTTSLSWIQINVKGHPPPNRSMHTFTAHRDKDIYVFGGENGWKSGGVVAYDDLYKFSLSSQKWKKAIYSGIVPSKRQGHAAAILHSKLFIIGGLGLDGELNDVNVLALINPSNRQPVLKPVAQGAIAGGFFYNPTKIPKLHYGIPTVLYSTPEQSTDDRNSEPTPFRDLSYIKKLTTKSIDDAIEGLKLEYAKLDSEKAELEESRKLLQQKEEAYQQMYLKQQRELELTLAKHQEVTEAWLLSRKQENDKDREQLAKLSEYLVEKQEEMLKEKEALAKREQHVFSVLKQFKDL